MKLTRNYYRLDGIFGSLTDDEGDPIAVTLEHSFEGQPLIPAGTYPCVRRKSPRFGYEVFMLTDVPGHDFIEIHVGNYQRDSEGCILLGRVCTASPTGWMVTSSQYTFDQFMASLDGIDSFQLTIENGPEF